jgi:hypothetical protein
MRHEQYREGLLTKLREWKLGQPDGTIADARRDLRPKLNEQEIDLLFDNWLNANFDRVEVREIKRGSFISVVRPRRESPNPDQRRREDIIAKKLAGKVRANHFEEFAARIWDTVLPNGEVLRDAKGKDLKHATGWFGELAKRIGPNEKVAKKFSTKQLFDLAQREKFSR